MLLTAEPGTGHAESDGRGMMYNLRDHHDRYIANVVFKVMCMKLWGFSDIKYSYTSTDLPV